MNRVVGRYSLMVPEANIGLLSGRRALFANLSVRSSTRPRDGRWIGRTELLNGGRQQMAINVREIELTQENTHPVPASLQSRIWPGVIREKLNSEYFYREGASTSYFHVQTESKDEIILRSPEAFELETKAIENALHEKTRGFAVQILFEGRGVRAHLEPAWPNLKIRLGVGGMMKDFTWVCETDANVKGYLHDKTGTILVLHGPTKDRVAKVAMAITLANKANPYSGKGAHLAFNPVQRRTPKKKKKGGK